MGQTHENLSGQGLGSLGKRVGSGFDRSKFIAKDLLYGFAGEFAFDPGDHIEVHESSLFEGIFLKFLEALEELFEKRPAMIGVAGSYFFHKL